jgi:transcriptional regulator with XRE-family HTH domain
MISPYVRRIRLANELKNLRTEAGITHEELAKRIGQSRAQISRLENGHIVDQADIIKILDALGASGDRWTTIMTIAREAGERGWWESNKAMGERQAMYANLEAGAVSIREYQMTFIPGLLQTMEFAQARLEAGKVRGFSGSIDKVIEARAGRQRMLRRPHGPHYEVIIDELAIRRPTVPDEALKAQIYHLTARMNGDDNVGVYVLPVDAIVDGFNVPRSAFSIYDYLDPDDPTVVTVDTVTEDLVYTDDADVKRYMELYENIRAAAWTQKETLEFLAWAAEEVGARVDARGRVPADG